MPTVLFTAFVCSFTCSDVLTRRVVRSRACSTLHVVLLAKKPTGVRQVASNKLARRNFEILQELEAGVSLFGTEVKSARNGQVNLRDGYCKVSDGECWLHNVDIAQWNFAGKYFQHDPKRSRRLLLHKAEIRKLGSECDKKGLTIVPLSAYFNEENKLKVQIGLAKGKNLRDKRETIKRREADRETQRQIKDFG